MAYRLHYEIGLLPKTRAARQRSRIVADSGLVALVSTAAVIRIDAGLVLLIRGRRKAIIDWCVLDLVRRGIAGSAAGFTALIVCDFRRSRSAISAQFVHRRALTDEPCQFGK